MNMNLFIKNQETVQGGLLKYLVVNFKDTIEYRPVTRYEQSTIKPDHGTYQECLEGDTVVRVFVPTDSESKFKPSLTLLKCVKNNDGLVLETNIDSVNLFDLVQITNDATVEWLSTDNPVLPAGYGWDGKYTKADLIKLKSALALIPGNLPKDLHTRYVNAVTRTSIKEFNNEPEVVKKSDYEIKDFIKKDDDIVIMDNKLYTDNVVGVNPNSVTIIHFESLYSRSHPDAEKLTINRYIFV